MPTESDKIDQILDKFISALSQPNLKDEFDRLHAKSQMQAGEIAKLHAENAKLKAENAKPSADKGGAGLDDSYSRRGRLLVFAKAQNDQLREALARKDEAMQEISKSNADLRERLEVLEENADRRESHIQALHDAIISARTALTIKPPLFVGRSDDHKEEPF